MSNKKILKLNELLILNVDAVTKRVSNRESERREFKLKFNNDNLSDLTRTMASFANRDGGVLFFGIRNQPRELIGVKESEIPDDVVFTNFLKQYFEPEILFESKTIELLGKSIHCLIIKPSMNKPVICRKSKSLVIQGRPQKEVLREGAIYYRYSASSDDF